MKKMRLKKKYKSEMENIFRCFFILGKPDIEKSHRVGRTVRTFYSTNTTTKMCN